MTVQYLSDEKGQVTAVQLPIEEWEMIKSKYREIDAEMPQWHKDVIDDRLDGIENNPDRIRPISELMDELDK